MKIGQFMQHKKILTELLPSDYECKIVELLDKIELLEKELKRYKDKEK